MSPQVSDFSASDYGLTKPTYDAKETQSLINQSHTSLYALIAAGELKATKIGRRTIFTAPDIAAFLNRRRAAGA
jgi:hypothetical protein